MKSRLPLFILLVCLFAVGPLRAQEKPAENASRWWYTVWLVKGSGSEAFTGSSRLEPEAFAKVIAEGTTLLKLENLRFPISNDKGTRWTTNGFVGNAAAVYITPRSVVYFFTYAAEPSLQE